MFVCTRLNPRGVLLAHSRNLAVLFLILAAVPCSASPPTEPAERAAAVGQPTAISVQPETVILAGNRASQQLIVTGRYADGSVRDLTPFCTYELPPAASVSVAEDGWMRPIKDGSATVKIGVAGKNLQVPVQVKGFVQSQPVSFHNEFIAALNVGGCNQGACHGTPSGKAGFKLSLRGYDPDADYLQLTRDALGRRTDDNGDESLIMLKALGRVPHEGGRRFKPGSVPARTISAWLSEGLRDDPPNRPTIKNIQILPGARLLHEPARWQQLAVIAHFSDGSARDVTRLTVFSSSDPAVADVDQTGLVEFHQAGEVAILVRYLETLETVRFTYLEPRKGFAWPNPPENNYVDHHVFAKLKMLSIPPSDLCTDQEFIRRAYLDLCGILPTADEVRKFLADRASDKRARLIDALLQRDEYSDFWTLKWADVLRNNRKTVQVKGAHVYQDWLHERIARDEPFNELVRELLTASGSTFANPAANYYRVSTDPTNLAESTAQLFFGIRMQCAKCHNHPFERWTQDDYYSMAAWFARVKLKKDPVEPGPNPQTPGAMIVYAERSGEITQPRTGKTMAPKVMGLPAPAIPPGKDRREALADLLASGGNPFFPKSVVNRIWFHLNGRGIVDPVDDFRDSNPSANDELLDALAKDFVAHHFDVKYLIRVIMNSRTYQLSAQSNDFNKDDNKYFSHAVTKLLPAEPLLDALCTATDVPEKFAGLPLGTRAVQLPDGEVNHPFLKTFGQPARELACECERESDSNLAQALQLINGPTVNEKLRSPANRIGKLLAKGLPDRAILEELYYATLSRAPADGEVKAALAHVAKAAPPDKRKAWEDVHWALLNSKEFLFRH
jgi:hypothetical protein